MEHKKQKEIKEKIWEEFGWSLRMWAKMRGFSQFAIYDVMRGKAGRDTTNSVLFELSKDGVIDAVVVKDDVVMVEKETEESEA